MASNIVARGEFTVSNLVDGKISYTHYAFANSIDGKTDFSNTNSSNKKFMGVYSDFVEAGSTDPSKYKWIELVGNIEQHIAYAWSLDGTDRFTSNKPNENLLIIGDTISSYIASATGVLTDATATHRAMKSLIDVKEYTKIYYKVYNPNKIINTANSARISFHDKDGKWLSNSADIPQLNGTNTQSSVFLIPDGAVKVRLSYIAGTANATTYDPDIKVKFEFGDKATIYTTNPKDDYDNAVPRYIGRSLKDSNDPTDYTWEVNPERKAWTGYMQELDGTDFSKVPYGENLITKSLFQSAIKEIYSGDATSGFLTNGNLNSKFLGKSKVSFSAQIEVLTNTLSVDSNIRLRETNGSWRVLSNNYLVKTGETPTFTVYGTYDFSNVSSFASIGISGYSSKGTGTMTVKITKLSVKIGEDTHYTPSPEDDKLGSIAKYRGLSPLPSDSYSDYTWQLNPDWLEVNTETIVTDKYSQSVQDLDGFRNTVGATYQTKDAMTGYYNKAETNSQINQKAGEITSTVSSTYTTKSDFNTGINNAATDATTKANNALASAKTDAATKANDAKAQAISAAKTETTSQVKQLSDSITSTVSKVEEKVDGISIGGRNLLLDTKTIKTMSGNGTGQKTVDKAYLFSSNSYLGQELTLSLDIIKSANTTGGNLLVNVGGTWQNILNIKISDISEEKPSHFVKTFTLKSDSNRGDVYFQTLSASPFLNGTLTFSNVKIEQGNRATDWTPAPEDIDANIDSALTTSKEYTNSQITQKAGEITASVSATYETKTNVANNLNTAKSYADTQANNAKTSAINTASTDATNKANDAKTAAITESKTYTDAQIKVTANSITSTVSETYETKTNVATNLNTAKSYADTQANNALASAKTDATNKANDAKSQAVSLAKTETTSQVKQLSDSITSTVSRVEEKVDGISIGGRNLIVHKNEKTNLLLNTSGAEQSDNYANTMVDSIAVTPNEWLYFQMTETINPYFFRWNYYDSDSNYLGRQTNASLGKSFKWQVPSNAYYIRVSYPNKGNVKLERGTMPTDWSVAPEDVDANIDGAITTSKEYTNSQITQKSGEITASVSATYETKQNVATNLNTAKSYADTQANNAKTAAINTASTDATTKANNAKTAAVTESKTYTDAQLKITSDSITSTVSKMTGAGNLVAKSTFEDGQKGNWTSGSLDTTIYKPDDTPSKMSRLLQWSTRDNYEDQWFDIKAGETYYFEAYLSAYSANYPVRFGMHMMTADGTNEWQLRASVPKGTGLQLVSGEYTVPLISKMIKARPFLQIDGNSDFGIAKAVGMRIENVTVAYSKIQQTADSIKSTVSQTYTTQNDFDSLKNKTDWRVLYSVQDLNNLTTTGKYWLQVSGNTNAPSSAWLYVSVDAPRSDRIKQTVQQDSSVSGYWERTYNGSWSGWRKMSDESWVSSQITQTAESINSTVSQKVGKSEVISTINQSAESVTINASKINLQGALTISQFSTSDRDKINNGISTANTANSTANTAQNKANDAYNLANTANGTANTANNQVNSWKKTGTTMIDGGNIYADNLSVITGNMGNLRINGELSGYSGSSRVSLLNYNSLNFYETDGSNNFKLSPSGITNINSGYGTRNIGFFSEGMAISPGSSNTGVTKNSGIRLLGSTSYIDLFSDKSTSGTDVVTRLIAESNGNGGINNNKGQFYINANSIALNTNVGVTGTLSMNGYSIVGAGNTIGTTGTGGWTINMMNIQGITGTPYLNVTSGSRSWGVTMWSSDMKLKKNIQKTTGKAIDIVDKLMVRQFDWRDSDRHTDYGLIAQNVERVLPQAVFEVEQKDKPSIKQLSPEGIIPVLVQAIQELKQEINELKNTK